MPETAGQISGPNRPEEHSVMFVNVMTLELDYRNVVSMSSDCRGICVCVTPPE